MTLTNYHWLVLHPICDYLFKDNTIRAYTKQLFVTTSINYCNCNLKTSSSHFISQFVVQPHCSNPVSEYTSCGGTAHLVSLPYLYSSLSFWEHYFHILHSDFCPSRPCPLSQIAPACVQICFTSAPTWYFCCSTNVPCFSLSPSRAGWFCSARKHFSYFCLGLLVELPGLDFPTNWMAGMTVTNV